MRFGARGAWGLGNLLITSEGYETRKGELPYPFKSWEQLEQAVLNHPDLGNLVFVLPDVPEAPPEAEAKPEAIHVKYHACPWCGKECDGPEELEQHQNNCEVLLKEKEKIRANIMAEMGLVGKDDVMPADIANIHTEPMSEGVEAEELKDVAAQEQIRKDMKAAEEQLKAEKRAAQKKLSEKIASKSKKKTTTKKTTTKTSAKKAK